MTNIIGTHSIVTDGLIFYLDAANLKSYPGTGTTWFDLSQTGNDSTINGATFIDNNPWRFDFDGVNDFVSTPDANVTNSFSVEFCALPESTHEIDAESTSSTTGTSGQKYILDARYEEPPDAGFGISLGTNGVSCYEHSAFYMPPLLVHSTTITSFTQITIVYTNKQPSLYLNGSFVKNGLTSTRTNVYLKNPFIGRHDYGYFDGKISYVRFYNKSLSASEVQQNFNALKVRFGL